MKSKMAILAALSILSALPSFAAADATPMGGQEAGNGGAGVVKNGVYMTFYSAGMYVEPDLYADPYQTVPCLKTLVDYISQYPYFSMNTRSRLLNAILPTANRRYLIARPDLLTSDQMQRLLAEFQRVTGQDPANLKLYALTDTAQNITFIMPDFFNLQTDSQKEAALMHEAAWILDPNSTYNDIVKTEMAFQASLENPSNYAAVFDFVSRVTTDANDLNSVALSMDLKSGALTGLVDSKNTISFLDLFGKEYFDCLGGDTPAFANDASGTSCRTFYRAHIADLQTRFPKSFLLNLIASRIDSQQKIYTLGFSAFETDFDNDDYKAGEMKKLNSDAEQQVKAGTIYSGPDQSYGPQADYNGSYLRLYLSAQSMMTCRLDLSNINPSDKSPNLQCPKISLDKYSLGGASYFDFGAQPN